MATDNSKSKNLNNIFKGTTISFLGPDGSGKSIFILELLKQQLPFERNDHFHLKPIQKKEGTTETVVEDPHAAPPYRTFKSYVKPLFFIYQNNTGWFKNIVSLKQKKSLVIFDRYFDDIIVDSRRYRYGGNKSIAKCFRNLILRAEMYFILTADTETIFKKNKEVAFTELQRPITQYRSIADGNRYHSIDVKRTPEEIAAEVKRILNHQIT